MVVHGQLPGRGAGGGHAPWCLAGPGTSRDRGTLPGLAGVRLQPPWEIGDVLEPRLPAPESGRRTLGDLALLPLGEVKAGPGDVVRVTVGLLTASPGLYVVAGFTIGRADGHDVASAVRSGLVLDIGRNGGCTGSLGGHKTDELLSYLAGLRPPAVPWHLARRAGRPRPYRSSSRPGRPRTSAAWCPGPFAPAHVRYCFSIALYPVVDKGSAAGLRQLLPSLDPLGAEDAGPGGCVRCSRGLRGPACPRPPACAHGSELYPAPVSMNLGTALARPVLAPRPSSGGHNARLRPSSGHLLGRGE